MLQLDLELSASGRKLLKDFTEDPTHAQHQLAVTLDKKVLQFPVVKSPHGMKEIIGRGIRSRLAA